MTKQREENLSEINSQNSNIIKNIRLEELELLISDLNKKINLFKPRVESENNLNEHELELKWGTPIS